ncbi:MAG: FAD-binding oxidoreductase [Chromatiales bacterium]|nr:FAD-binding oxidoreductase [Chromatiales bacterium]
MKANTLVIGAGIVGICCARALQLRGDSVTIIDREGIGDGCSHGNAGVLCSWSFDPASKPGMWKDLPRWLMDPLGPIALQPGHLLRMIPWIRQFFGAARPALQADSANALFTLNNPSVEMYRQLLRGSGHESLVRDANYVFVTRNANRIDPGQLAWRRRREHGANIEMLTGDEVREMEPALSSEYVKAMVVTGQGRVTNPGRLVKVLGELVLADGGTFIRGDVTGFPGEGTPTAVTTTAGDIEADRVIVTAGAWSHQLVKSFGVNVPLQGERGYHMEFANPGVELNHSVNDYDRAFVASSMEGGVRCAGTSEFAGLEAAPNWRRAEMLQALGKSMLPTLNVAEGTPWMGRRPAVPDSVPVIGPVPSRKEVYMAFGHGHYGLTAGPMTGRIIAAMAGDERLNMDVTPYSVDRFS